MILAAAARGETNIYNPATEPHIVALAELLSSAGAKIDILPGRIRVGGGELRGARGVVIPDMIEAGTYLIAGLVTRGEVTVSSIEPEHLGAFIDAITEAGAEVSVGADSITAKADSLRRFSVTTAPYPGFPTDLQPQIGALMAAFSGGEITEGVWRARFGYLREFEKFGVSYFCREPNAVIGGGSLRAARVAANDLRAAAAEVILALGADGESIVENARHIRRGYSDMGKKMRSLGARLEYVD